MDVVKTKYKHGLAAVSRLMTSGKGRGGNKVIYLKNHALNFIFNFLNFSVD